jgi:hypothetical protein
MSLAAHTISGPAITNPVAGASLAAINAGTSGDPAYVNAHGLVLRNGPIGVTANSDTIGFAFSASASVLFWLAPGEAFRFAPADAADTSQIFIQSASGGSVTCLLEVAG